MDAKREIEVAVLAQTAAGRSDLIICKLEVTAAEIADGVHFVKANRSVQKQGMQPLAAFDSSQPAWKVVSDGQKYKRFFDDATEALQDVIVPGPERCAGGADTVQLVDELFKRHSQEELVYVAVSADGYWSNRDGWVSEPQWATIVRDPADLQKLSCSAALAVVPLAMDKLDDLMRFPSLEQLEEAAEGAIQRAHSNEYSIGVGNAEEVLGEKLGLNKVEFPQAATAVFAGFMLNAQKKQAEELRRRVVERA